MFPDKEMEVSYNGEGETSLKKMRVITNYFTEGPLEDSKRSLT